MYLMKIFISILIIFSFSSYAFDFKYRLKDIFKLSSVTIIINYALLSNPMYSYSIDQIDNSVSSQLKTNINKPYGLKKGRLLTCNIKSNCISTSSINSVEKYSRPWQYVKSVEEEYNDILNIINNSPYLKIAETDDKLHYIRAEAKSAFPPTGIDDVELLLNDNDKIITYRSNSREIVPAGTEIIGDAGSNRNRLNGIKSKLGVEEMMLYDETENFIKKEDSKNFIVRLREASTPNEINFIDNSVPE